MLAMISQPMRGLSIEEIWNARKDAMDHLQSNGYSVFNNVFDFPENFAKNMGAYCFAKSIECMAQADLVYFMHGWEDASGCVMEYMLAKKYGIPIEFEDDFSMHSLDRLMHHFYMLADQ